MKKTFFLFFVILLLALFLRFWHLGGVPISPNWDEAALGYNAYSILKTNRDEYGIFLPLILRSFNNYTPAVYAYAALPAIVLFDLTPFAVRFPSAVMGTFAVIGVFFLSRELFSLYSGSSKGTTYLSLLTMVLFAISPWHIQFSRVAYEASIGFTLVVYGFLFFLVGLKKPVFFLASAFCFGLSMNTYHSPRLFVPLFLVGLGIIFRKRLLARKKQLLFPLLIGCIFLLPFVYFLMSDQSKQFTARFQTTSIFAKKDILVHPTFFDHPVLHGAYMIWTGYLTHFSPTWLFVTGDNDRHHAPSTGLLYIWELPFLLLGLISIILSKGHFRSVFFLWFLLVPVPASLTTEVPHAVRTLLFLPSFQLAIALGLAATYQWIRQKSMLYQAPLGAVFITVVTFSFFQYTHLYFFQMNHEASRFWQFGYEHAVNYVQQNREKYKKIVVSNKLEQPYIFFLFYTRFDPSTYFAAGGTKDTPEQAFDLFEFRTIAWDAENHDGSTLYLLAPDEQRGNALHTIRYFDSSEAMIFSE